LIDTWSGKSTLKGDKEMIKARVVVLIILLVGSLVACAPVPFDEACDHIDKTITINGYFVNPKCEGSENCCGAVIVPGGLQETCSFYLYGQPDQEGPRLVIWMYHNENISSFDSESKLIEMLCKNETTCSIDGTSQFSIVGIVKPPSMEGDACGIRVDGFKNARFIP
jgi:hypothetical protein